MANAQFGKSDWSNQTPDVSGDEKKSDFMKLPPGMHTVRLITAPYNYVFFKVKLATDPGVVNQFKFYGDKIKASMPMETNPLRTVLGLRPKQGTYAGIIDRKTGRACVLDMPQQVNAALQKWRLKKGYGDLQSFDFDIQVDPTSKNSYYSVLPSIPEALSEEDLKKKTEFDEKQLERLIQPISDHAIQMKWLNEKRERNGLTLIEFSEDAAAAKVAADDSDEDTEFQAADSASVN